MVTGDDVATSAAIAKQVGIPGEAILGTDFATMAEAERPERIDHIGVVARVDRVAPEHKVLLAETLKRKATEHHRQLEDELDRGRRSPPGHTSSPNRTSCSGCSGPLI